MVGKWLGKVNSISFRENVLQTDGGMGLLWYYRRKFKGFTLELEWRASSRKDNSGIFIRLPNPRNDPYVAVDEGYEIQIDDLARLDGKPIHSTGAVYGFAAPYMIDTNQSENGIALKLLQRSKTISL